MKLMRDEKAAKCDSCYKEAVYYFLHFPTFLEISSLPPPPHRCLMEQVATARRTGTGRRGWRPTAEPVTGDFPTEDPDGSIVATAGNYVSKSEDFRITKTLSIIGCNVSTVVIQSNVVVKHAKLFEGGQTRLKNIKFVGDVEPQKQRGGLVILLGVDILVEDCWFSAEDCDDA